MKKLGMCGLVVALILLVAAVILVPKIDVLKSSNIINDNDYKNYLKLEKNGEIDENGEYNVVIEDPDKIRVSFAVNQSLDIEYYLDSAKTEKIDGTAYLLPGDTIYFDFIESKDDAYNFSRYEVFEITDDNTRERIVKIKDTQGYWAIPENFKGKEIQIIPYGEYNEQSVNLVVKDENGDDVISGIWKNYDEELTDNTLSLNPSEYYELSYSYNSDDFFFVESTPECQNSDYVDGTVLFQKKNSSEPDSPIEYFVELHRYLKLSFEFDKKAKILHNGKDVGGSKKYYKEYEFEYKDKLKFGDTITIETESNFKITDGDYKYLNISREYSSSKGLYIYIIEVKRENYDKQIKEKVCDGVDIIENITITLPDKTSYGILEYKVNSNVVKGTCTIKEGDKLEIEYTITKSGYVFSNQNKFEKIFKFKTKKEDVEISADMDGTTLDLSKYFEVEKEV